MENKPLKKRNLLIPVIIILSIAVAIGLVGYYMAGNNSPNVQQNQGMQTSNTTQGPPINPGDFVGGLNGSPPPGNTPNTIQGGGSGTHDVQGQP